MSKRAPQPSYLQPIECMGAPCVRHAAQMVEQAMYEADWPMRPADKDIVLGPRTNGVGIAVGPLFPKQVEHPHWRKAYADELEGSPHLLAMLTRDGSSESRVKGVMDAAGLTEAQREAIELVGFGMGVREIARTLGIRVNAAWERIQYGKSKLKALDTRHLNGGVLHVA